MVPEKAMDLSVDLLGDSLRRIEATPKKWFRTMPTPYSESMLLAETVKFQHAKLPISRKTPFFQ